MDVIGSIHSLYPKICDVDAVGIGSNKSELRSPYILILSFNKIFVSTDSRFMQNISLKKKVECPILRSKKLSGDKTPMKLVILNNCVKLYNYNQEYYLYFTGIRYSQRIQNS